MEGIGGAVVETAESAFVRTLAAGCLPVSPDEPVWKWAEREVWLGGKQAATPDFYDSSKTPWTREIQMLPMQPEVREGVALKCSQSGFTEASLNILRWMPDHWPGNALYTINSLEKAKDVAEKRIQPTMQKVAAGQFTEDANDVTARKIALLNMDVVVAGSGSSGPFMEAWYRYMILDELENHIQNQETTTEDRAGSRQATVADGLVLKLSKPELAGGIIDLAFIRGTQEKWMVPCPHCGERIELVHSGMRFGHCKDLVGAWDLARVLTETWYQCPGCSGRIEEWQKPEMVNAGVWEPTPFARRRKVPGGTVTAPEPGIRSFHISDFYSLWPKITWGYLAVIWLKAFVIEPDEARQKFYRTNHEGLPWDPKEFQVNDDALNRLVAGIQEEKDGLVKTLGVAYNLAYGPDGKLPAPIPLPIAGPLWLTITGDRQKEVYKYWVQAWTWDGQGYLIDIGEVSNSEDHYFLDLRLKPYYVVGFEEPYFISSGLVDCGDEKVEVLKMCVKGWSLGFSLFPSRGSGWNSEFKGKNVFYRMDTVEGVTVPIREFYDYAIKNEFYLGKIGRRSEPRLWFPNDLPEKFKAELRSERLVTHMVQGRPVQRWEHDKAKYGPNDGGDLGKQQYVIFQEIKDGLAGMKPEPAAQETPDGQTKDTRPSS